jgi:hypothetical protein
MRRIYTDRSARSRLDRMVILSAMVLVGIVATDLAFYPRSIGFDGLNPFAATRLGAE